MDGGGVAVRRRVLWALCGVTCLLALLGVRLFWLQAWRGASLYRRAVDVHTRVVPLQARRGEITDRRGRPLAISVGVDSVYAVPAQVRDRTATASALSPLLHQTATVLGKKLSRHTAFVWLARRVDPVAAAAVRRLRLPGVSLVQESRRVYPRGMFAGPILGFVGIDNQGLAGLELSYDHQLRGRNGELIIETDARGREIPGGVTRYVPPVQGDTLRTTLSSTLQSIVQRNLDAGVAAAHAKAGYALMMDPSTGAILAWAAWPTFDPNAFRQADPSLWTNPLLTLVYSPGSVFKPITAAAALQEGLITPSSPFDDSGVFSVGGVNIHNFNRRGLGPTTFAVGFQKSANTIFARVGVMLGVQRFYRYLRAFGFTGRTGVDLPGEARQPNLLRPEHLATPLDVAEESFGQTLAVTPLSMLTAISAIANGGNLPWPHLGAELLSPAGAVVRRIEPRTVRRVLSPQTAYTVQSLMASVVEQGSGRQAAIACYSVAGKTGTTQKYVGGRIGEGAYIGSFLGFAPAHGARVALYVMIDEPQGLYYGGQVAAPVFRAIMVATLRHLGLPAACPAGQRPPAVRPLPAETVAMPDVVGLPPADAERLAAERGLFLRVDGASAAGGAGPAGGARVLRQVPPAGAQVAKWSTVLAYTTPALALPEQSVTVPDLQGLTLTQAAATLSVEGLGLRADGTGRVIAQSPAPGAAAHPGDVVEATLR